MLSHLCSATQRERLQSPFASSLAVALLKLLIMRTHTRDPAPQSSAMACRVGHREPQQKRKANLRQIWSTLIEPGVPSIVAVKVGASAAATALF